MKAVYICERPFYFKNFKKEGDILDYYHTYIQKKDYGRNCNKNGY